LNKTARLNPYHHNLKHEKRYIFVIHFINLSVLEKRKYDMYGSSDNEKQTLHTYAPYCFFKRQSTQIPNEQLR